MTAFRFRALFCCAGLCFVLTAAVAASEPAETVRLSREEAVLLALRGNAELEIARHERNVARIEADRDRPALRPQVNAVGSQVFRTPRVDLPGKSSENVLPNSMSRFSLELRQPLYQFGVGNAASRRVDAMNAAAGFTYRAAELDTVLQAREAYLGVRRAAGYVVIATRGMELAAENLRVTSLLRDRGLQADVDVLDAERALAEAQADLVRTQNGDALARANLNRLLGRPIDGAIELTTDDSPLAEPGELSTLTEIAGRERPELAELRQKIAAAEAGIRLAKASRQPRVNLEAAYDLQTETALVPRSGISGGVSIIVPIFSGAVNRYTVREAEERKAQLQTALAAREQAVALEIEQQRLADREARQRLLLAKRAIAAAEKSLEIVKLRLDRGRAVQVEVQNARLALLRALTDQTAAELDIHLAGVRLERAIGRGPSLETPAAATKSPTHVMSVERK